MASEIKANKISPATGTAFTFGDSGDTFTIPSGATIANSGTATGFGGDNTPSFYAYLSSAQSIATSSATKVTLDTELWDTDSAFDSTTNYRFTVPSGEGGKYCFSYGAKMEDVDDGNSLSMSLYKNGSGIGYGYANSMSPGVNKAMYVQNTVTATLSASDYIECFIFQNNGGTLNAIADQTFFSGFKLIGV